MADDRGTFEEFTRQSKFRCEDFDTITLSKLPWRVKGLWPSVGVCFVAGASMSGKSFRVIDWMSCICRGLPVLGRKSLKAGVVYVAAEGAEGVRNRIAGLRGRIGPLGSAFQFIGQAPDLTDSEEVADLRATVAATQADMAQRGQTLGVVAVDTLAASMPGGDENGSKDMGPVLAALQSMAADLRVLVLVVTHTGKDESRGMRGWSGQLGNADGAIIIDDPKGAATRVGTVLKVKDGAAGDRFAFTLKVVEIGTDDDGDAITTCVVEEAEVPDGDGSIAGQTRLNAAAQQTWNALERLLAEGQGRQLPLVPGVRQGQEGVTLDQLREQAYSLGLQRASEPAANAPETERKRWFEARKKSFQRAVEKLVEARKVRQEGDWIWPL